MELDHIFIRTRAGAPEAAQLITLGLTEGSANRHAGQGTANRRFFFDNAFLELLWIEDATAVTAPATAATQLAQRLSLNNQHSSPFGLCFRPSAQSSTPTFNSWAYQPAYLPAGLQVDIAEPSPLHEPMWFFLASAVAPKHAPPARRQPLHHPAGIRRLSTVRLTIPGAQHWSAAARAAASHAIILQPGTEHLLELTFDQGQTRQIDLRPTLPLILRY